MNCSRRELIGLMAIGALAGCTGSGPGGSGDDSEGDGQDDGEDLPGGSGGDNDETSLAGSCASAFGDTMERYDVGSRNLLATFSYPMGGEIISEQDDSVARGTSIGYGEGELSSLHSVTIFERGPTSEPLDATVAYEFDDRMESGTVTTFGGQERPVAIFRRDDPAVSYIFHVQGPDGVYLYDVTTSAGESDGCPDVYESVTRRIAESFETVA